MILINHAHKNLLTRRRECGILLTNKAAAQTARAERNDPVMKKLFSLFLVFSLIFALAACSSTPAAAPTDAPTEAPTDEPTAEPASAGSDTAAKTKLVVGTSADFPPYEYYDGDKIVGVEV